MRIVGIALLLVGYMWLLWDQASIGPIARAAIDQVATTGIPVMHGVGLTPLASLPDTAYTLRNDQAKGLPIVGIHVLHDLLPDFTWSGTMMLLGGLVLARESWRRKGAKHLSETGAKP